MNESNAALLARITHNTTHHPPTPQKVGEHEAIREAARQYMIAIANLPYPSREQSLALTAAEESLMWANAAIARSA